MTPALAANEFYVVQDTASKKCSIARLSQTSSLKKLSSKDGLLPADPVPVLLL